MLTSVMADFSVSVDIGQWLTTGYMLVLGVVVPAATFLQRRLSERGYLALCFVLFLAGSVIDFLAPWFALMLCGRILQAMSVGLLIPELQTMCMTRFDPGRQATAMGVAGIALGFAPNAGPALGGAMDFAFGWRSLFALHAVLTLLLLVSVFAFAEDDAPDGPRERLETPSFVLSTFGFGGILLGLSQASAYGLKSAFTWLPVAIGAACLALFLLRQRSVPNPLMDLRIFKSASFRSGLLASVFLFACYMGVTLVIPLFVEDVLGGTSLDAGLVILPTTFTALLVNPLAGWLADRVGMRVVTLTFGLFLAAGSIACAFVGVDTPLWALSLFQAIRAIGVSGLVGPLLTFMLSQLAGTLVAHGSSASVIIRQVAATFGTAIMVLCITALIPMAQYSGASVALPYQAAFAFSAAMGVACLATIAARVK